MTKYGKALQQKNGFKLVEVVDIQADGSFSVIGYAILGPEGNEIGRFATLAEAETKFWMCSQPRPRDSSGPSFC